jgi:exodeoxyribonuclease-5
MILTKRQEQGLKLCIEKYINNERYCIISGYAGAGKSTLVKVIIQNLPNINPENDVVYACFTGKAAQVLLKKGNKNVMTLHKLLYESIPKPDGTFFRKPKQSIDYKIVVVDEVSMAPRNLMELLFKHNVFIIALGDPFQLPPVDKDQDNGLLNNPDIFLNEIMRQSLDSEIIQLSMKIRNHQSIDYFKGKDVIIMPKSDLNTGVLQWADQILVGTNATRVAINNQMRDLLGFEKGVIGEHERLTCLRNYWDNYSNTDAPLINGTMGYLSNSYETYYRIPPWIKKSNNTIPIISGNFTSEDGDNFGVLDMDKNYILIGEGSLTQKEKYTLGKNPKYQKLIPYEFTYGYAITTHRAQGSEWSKVLVIEEKFPFNKEEHARWLYTACTRASSKLVLVR